MLEGATALAIALYLVPPMALALVVARRTSLASEIALCLPAGVALDALVTVLCARVVRFEVAVLLTRAAWIAGTGIALYPRKLERPRALGRAEIFAAIAGAALGAFISLSMSRDCWVWDREWHVPFVALVRGEAAPFANVYERFAPIHYHHAGDVVAAMFQVLSLDVMHATRALAVSHDVLFAVNGATIAIVVREITRATPLTSALLAALPATVGPVFLRDGTMGAFEGYADFNNLTLSFRPGALMSGLFLCAITALLFVRSELELSARAFFLLLAPLVWTLSFSDEISTANVGVALGAVWLVSPRVFGARRWRGLAALVAVGAAIFVVQRAVGGALVPGGPVNQVAVLAARFPNFYAPSTPWFTSEARERFACDLLVELVLGASIVLAFIARPRRSDLGVLAFVSLVFAVALFCFLKVEINGRYYEAHRFMTAPRWILPIVAILWLSRARSALRLIAVLALALGASSTAGYALHAKEKEPRDQRAEYALDCRAATGARGFEAPAPTYIEEAVWYTYAGCHPVYAPGGVKTEDRERGVMAAGWPKHGAAAIAELRSDFVRPSEPLRVVCGRRSGDAVCARAEAIGPCRDEGELVRCDIPADRAGEL